MQNVKDSSTEHVQRDTNMPLENESDIGNMPVRIADANRSQLENQQRDMSRPFETYSSSIQNTRFRQLPPERGSTRSLSKTTRAVKFVASQPIYEEIMQESYRNGDVTRDEHDHSTPQRNATTRFGMDTKRRKKKAEDELCFKDGLAINLNADARNKEPESEINGVRTSSNSNMCFQQVVRKVIQSENNGKSPLNSSHQSDVVRTVLSSNGQPHQLPVSEGKKCSNVSQLITTAEAKKRLLTEFAKSVDHYAYGQAITSRSPAKTALC